MGSQSQDTFPLRRRAREKFSWSVIALIALGFALRIFRVGSQSLWIDEVLSLADSTALFHQSSLGPGLLHNLHGPLYSLLVFVSWQVAGLNEFWLRFPSVLAGAATLGAMYVVAASLYDRHTAWWAVLLMALSPLHVWYSQEARNYSLMLLFATLSMYFFDRLLKTGDRRSWVHYVWTTAAALLSNLSAFFLLVAQAPFALAAGFSNRRHLLRWSLAVLAVAVAVSPWFLEFVRRLQPERALSTLPVPEEELLRGETTFTLWGIPFTFFVFSLGYSVGPSLREMHLQEPIRAVVNELGLVPLAGLVFALVALLGVWKSRDHRRTLLVLLLYIAIPALLLSLVSARNVKVFNPRYLIVSLPAYLLLLARGLSQVGRPWLRWGCVGLVVLLSLCSLLNYYFDPRYAREDIRAAARYIEVNAQPQDVILTSNCRTVFDLYYTGQPVLQPRLSHLRTSPVDTSKVVAEIIDGYERAWLVQAREWGCDPNRALEKYLQMRFGLVDEQRFPGVRLSLFALGSSEEGGNR